jgi:hypothetical protein
MFTVEYRDDVKVLQAFRNRDLIEKLTANEVKLLAKAENIVSTILTPGMSEYEIVLAVHDYIILNGKYATQHDDPAIQSNLHKAEGILMDGVGVCSSYAGSMQLLLGMANINSLFVTGIGQNKNGLSGLHAWNIVMIDGRWYNFDITWDDPTPDKPGVVSYAYFGLPDDVFSADHIWNREAYPAANSHYHNYYRYNDLWANNYNRFKTIISREIKRQSDKKEIKVHMYVENYRAEDFDLNFIFNLVTGAEKVTYTKINGTQGEFVLTIIRKKGLGV